MVIANLNPIRSWLKREYARPVVNPEWLQGCCNALSENDPGINTRDLIHAVNLQLLLSSLSDSCLPHTGLPDPDALDDLHGEILFQKDPCLVMVMSIMEVGHSAFQLQTTMENRKEALSGVRRIRRIRNPQADGVEEDEAEEDDDDEAIPPYPRGLLRLELSDGFNTFKAMEYKRIDGLTLGETALGSKMVLKGVQIRRGILMLTPTNTVLKGHMVEEIEMHQGRLFQNALLRALGKPELPLEEETVEEDPNAYQLPPLAHAQAGFADDRFSEYEGDMEYDLIASGIDLSAPGPPSANTVSSRPIQAGRGNEEDDFYPEDDDFEALMVMQERAQARAQAPAGLSSASSIAAVVNPEEELEEDWEVLAAMEAEAEEGNRDLLRNDQGPKPPARLTLGLPFHKAEATSSSRQASSIADDENPTTRSRFFGKNETAELSKRIVPRKSKQDTTVYLDEEKEMFPPLEYVYDQEEEDGDYVPGGTSPPSKRKYRAKGKSKQPQRAGRGEATAFENAMNVDDDEDDFEDSQKENRPTVVKRNSQESTSRASVPMGKRKVQKYDPDDDVIEISD